METSLAEAPLLLVSGEWLLMLMRAGRDQKASAEPDDKQRKWDNGQLTTKQNLNLTRRCVEFKWQVLKRWVRQMESLCFLMQWREGVGGQLSINT